jgi:ubiquitin-protein ligase
MTTNSDNYVITQYKSAQGVSEFLLRNAYYALNSNRANIIFEPIPPSWKQKLNENINDIIKRKNINTNIENVFSVITNSYNDIEIIDNLGIETYELVRFILESNKLMIKVDNLLKSTDVIQIDDNKLISKDKDKNNDILSSILQFKLIHTQLVEDKFKDKSTTYLYHGSSYENWYSIMRNGVKIGSDSKYFMNGAAYGKGVYLSNDINLSLGYSNQNHINKTDCQKILAIFEVENNPKWHKGGTIYVVNNEDALILRYLLVFNNIYDPLIQGVFKAINIKLNNGGIKAFDKEKKDMEAKNITIIHNKRLMREYQMIMKQVPEKLGFRIALAQEDNLGRWIVYITKPENTKLESQMKKLNIPAIEIEITFKDTYPISPPFIRVVYPHFKFHSGHITVGGSLCMEMLTNQGWSPTFNVENVITQIKLAISDGGGAIDEVNYKKRYTMDEAVDSFKRVLASHGWV